MGITVTGLAETQLALKNYARIELATAYVKALKAGLDVLAAELYTRVPSHRATADEAEGGKVLKQLKDSIVSEVILSDKLDGGEGKVGFGNLGYIALWVEFGHRLVRGGRLNSKKGAGAGKLIGFVQPHPFMRPAFEAARASI
jgi:hypothetical protein